MMPLTMLKFVPRDQRVSEATLRKGLTPRGAVANIKRGARVFQPSKRPMKFKWKLRNMRKMCCRKMKLLEVEFVFLMIA